MQIHLIVAQSTNRVIGKDNQLPWRLPADLKRFKRLTMGHYMLMGRKTFESIGKPLPGRTSVVISRNPNYLKPGIIVVNTIEAALSVPRQAGAEAAFIIGGAEVFNATLPLAHRLYLTQVHEEVEGDVFFPEISPQEWQITAQIYRTASHKNPYPYTFIDYQRTG